MVVTNTVILIYSYSWHLCQVMHKKKLLVLHQLCKTVEASIHQHDKTRKTEVLLKIILKWRDFWYLEMMSYLTVYLQNALRILDQYLSRSKLNSVLVTSINRTTLSFSYQTGKHFVTCDGVLTCLQ